LELIANKDLIRSEPNHERPTFELILVLHHNDGTFHGKIKYMQVIWNPFFIHNVKINNK